MPYRQADLLGSKLTEHRLSGAGARSYLLATLIAGAFSVAFLWYAFQAEQSLKPLGGAICMAGFAVWAHKEGRRLAAIRVAVHEKGLRYSSDKVALEILWGAIADLEARYLPGARNRGLADEGNCVGLFVHTARDVVELPKDLVGFREIWTRLEERTERAVRRVLVVPSK